MTAIVGVERRPHPACYSRAVLAVIERHLPLEGLVLDPFAGTGRVHQLATGTRPTVGVELEPEWAAWHPDTLLGDATRLPFADRCFDAIATSPAYGNRMADHHEAKDDSRRHTYRHTLGRPLHRNNAGALQWGDRYRVVHWFAWLEAVRVLRPGGRLVVNVSDHFRKGQLQPVARWHLEILEALGLFCLAVEEVPTPRLRHGANGGLRADHEIVAVFTKGIPGD